MTVLNELSGGFSDQAYIKIPPQAVNNLREGTIEAWVKLSDVSAAAIIAKQIDDVNTFGVLSVGVSCSSNGWPQAGTPGKVYFHAKNFSSEAESTTLLATNTWYHLAVAFTSTECKLYINGVLDSTTSGDFSIPDNTQTSALTSIGAWLGDGGGQYFNGDIFSIIVWGSSLSETQITQSMQELVNSGAQHLQYLLLPGTVISIDGSLESVEDTPSNP